MTNFDYSTNYSINWKDPLKDNPIEKNAKSTFSFKDLVKITINEGKAQLEIKSGFPLLNQAHLKSLVVAATHFEQEGDLLLKALLQDPCSASFILGNLYLHAEGEVISKILKIVTQKLTGFQEKPILDVEEIKFLHQFGQLLSSETLNHHDGVLFFREVLKELIIEKAPESTAEIEKIKKLKEGLLNKTISFDEMDRFVQEIDPKYQNLFQEELLSDLAIILLIARSGGHVCSSKIKGVMCDRKSSEVQEILIEIAKTGAAQDGWETSRYIKDYGIESEKNLIEIAKIAVSSGSWLSPLKYIPNYGIESQEDLIEIAKIAAAQYGGKISKHIQNYGIKSQEGLIEIAKIAAAQDGDKISKHIQNYGIKLQEGLIEIAKIAVAQDGKATSEHIQNYGIESQEGLIEIAKIAAAQNGKAISEYIQNYGIKLQKGLIEIAKIAVAQDGKAISEHIQNYGIKLQEGLIEIAKIAAAQDGKAISEHIKNYGIKLQEGLIEIAKIAAAQDGWTTSKHIKNYGIESQEGLIEIAKIAAAQNGRGASCYIKDFGIESQKDLIEIAKIVAAQNGWGASYYIKNFNIKSQKDLIEIAKIAAAQDGEGTSEWIKNYNLSSQKDLWDIYLICLSSDLSLKINEFNILSPALTTFLDKDIGDVTWDRVENEVLPLLQQGYPSIYPTALNIITKFNKDRQSESPPASLIHSLRWLLIASEQQPDKELSHPIWKDILKYPDPQMRYRLLQSASKVLSDDCPFGFDPNTYELYPKGPYKTHPIAHMHLPDLLLTEMGIRNLQPLLASKRIFRDGRALKLLLDTLVLLKKEGISIQKIEKLMTDLLRDEKKIKTALELIQGVAACKGLEELQSGKIEHLKNLFEKTLKTLVPLQSKNFAEDFLRTFGNQREYTSLLVYVQRHIKNKEVLACLAEMIDSVFNDDYLQNRYQGVHLEEVFSLRPDLKDFWIPNITFDLKKIFNDLNPSQSEGPNYYQFFHEKVVADRHIDQAQYPFLVRYLQNKEKRTPIEGDKGPTLQLQRQIIEFLEKSPTLSLEEQKKSLIEIRSHFSTDAEAQNFVHDLQGLIDGFNKKEKNIDELQMLLTDDYWDLFRCGSEVTGSCQRLDGYADLNKCLLAYVVDGKNKILEIKGNDGKICARAILRLLIDDSRKEPVLFLERTYANPGIDKHLQDTLEGGAKELARKWNLPLYRSAPSSPPVTLISLGSSAPWEYVDSAFGVHPKGVFTIATAQLVE